MIPSEDRIVAITARDLFASIDWSPTSIGPVDTWPPRLRALADVVLFNRYPMIVIWGPDALQVVYNDAYARLIGKRHPSAMGKGNQQTWPEVWHINGPIYAAVLNEGREFYFEDALYLLERNDWREEVYLTISYAPVFEDADRIGGILVTMIETTRNVLAERRLRSLRDLTARTARLRSTAEIAAAAAAVLAENVGDIVFASIFATADDGDGASETDGVPRLLGNVGLGSADALDLREIAFATVGAGGSARMRLGKPSGAAGYPTGAHGEPVHDAYVAALPRALSGGVRGSIVIGLSPALPRDALYCEYLDLIAAQLAAAFENASIFSREHRIADTLQRAALPGTLPPFDGLVVDAVYEAGSSEAQIGGDWYDAFALRDGRVVLSIGDVSGSGVVAAAAMGAVRQMIRGLAQMLDNPAEILNAVDRALRLDRDSRIITAFVGFLSADHRRLSYASAGHPAPFVRRPDGSIVSLFAPDLPLGLRDDRIAEPAQIALGDGSVVVLYTDGLTEATRDPIEGERRLTAALASAGFAAQPRKAAYLYDKILDRRANDDVALLVIELRSGATARTVPAMGGTYPARFDDESFATPSNAFIDTTGVPSALITLRRQS